MIMKMVNAMKAGRLMRLVAMAWQRNRFKFQAYTSLVGRVLERILSTIAFFSVEQGNPVVVPVSGEPSEIVRRSFGSPLRKNANIP
jgi:hypothetical protein